MASSSRRHEQARGQIGVAQLGNRGLGEAPGRLGRRRQPPAWPHARPWATEQAADLLGRLVISPTPTMDVRLDLVCSTQSWWLRAPPDLPLDIQLQVIRARRAAECSARPVLGAIDVPPPSPPPPPPPAAWRSTPCFLSATPVPQRLFGKKREAVEALLSCRCATADGLRCCRSLARRRSARTRACAAAGGVRPSPPPRLAPPTPLGPQLPSVRGPAQAHRDRREAPQRRRLPVPDVPGDLPALGCAAAWPGAARPACCAPAAPGDAPDCPAAP